MPMRGENVRFALISPQTGASTLPLYDNNQNLRVVGPNERFVMDSCNVGITCTANAYVSICYDGSSTASTIPLIAFGFGSTNCGSWMTAYEGLSGTRGGNPWVFTAGSVGGYRVTGTGYILEDGGSTMRSIGMSNLTPGGNY